MNAFLKNLVLTTLLAVIVLFVAYESTKRGLFRSVRLASGPESRAESGAKEVATEPIEPTPTPLPAHFPTVEDDDLKSAVSGYLGLTEAFKTCWPQIVLASTPAAENELRLTDIEKLFGKIKKRETLEENDASRRYGLLFDTSIFAAGAAGSAIETDGQLTELHLRAGGRMLHCENEARCECLASLEP